MESYHEIYSAQGDSPTTEQQTRRLRWHIRRTRFHADGSVQARISTRGSPITLRFILCECCPSHVWGLRLRLRSTCGSHFSVVLEPHGLIFRLQVRRRRRYRRDLTAPPSAAAGCALAGVVFVTVAIVSSVAVFIGSFVIVIVTVVVGVSGKDLPREGAVLVHLDVADHEI